jgi:hypothetical protein
VSEPLEAKLSLGWAIAVMLEIEGGNVIASAKSESDFGRVGQANFLSTLHLEKNGLAQAENVLEDEVP